MKKKQGFTLIELLAVIIILAVIALIATPIILNIIERARISAAEASAKGYAEAVNYVIIDKNFANQGDYDGTYDVIENVLGASYDGQGPSKGHYVVEKNRVKSGEFCINGYPIKYENGYGKYAPESTICETGTDTPTQPVPEDGAYKLCTNEVNYDDITELKVYRVEDLTCISVLAQNGKTFDGKTITLQNDININSNNNYYDATAKFPGDVDINENGTVEGIKAELTTSKGFLPIGNSTTSFAGTFEGNAYTISNLMINRPDANNVGLFGYFSGKLQGVNLEGFNIIGNDNVGGIVGLYLSGTIHEITFEGNVTGHDYVGGAVGDISIEEPTDLLVRNAIVTGNDYVGGIVGSGNSSGFKGIIEKGKVTGNSVNVGKVTGNGSTINSYSSSEVIVLSSDEHNTTLDGVNYIIGKNMIGAYDMALDTYIGGDNDSSGYYFDYENDNSDKIIVKFVEREPLIFKLQGEGTKKSPYIINDAQDWKNATLKIKGNYYFEINNNIDFSNEHFYMLGGPSNNFTGNLNGNMNTLSNIEITGFFNGTGLIGYNRGGTIEGINIDSITVVGRSAVGAIVGYDIDGTIKGINIKGANITGSGTSISDNSDIGGVVGYADGIYQEITFEGNVTGQYRVGGIVGNTSPSDITTITSVLVRDINITGNYSSGVGGIVGYANSQNKLSGIVESGKLPTGSAIVGGYNNIDGIGYYTSLVESLSKAFGINYSSDYINNLSYYSTLKYNENPIIETAETGDINGSGYYFGYGSDGKIVVVKAQ